MSTSVRNTLIACGSVALFAASYFGVRFAYGISTSGQTVARPSGPSHGARNAEAAHAVVADELSNGGDGVDRTAATVDVSRSAHDEKTAGTEYSAGVLGAFVMPAPFNSEELADLQRRLVDRLAEVEVRIKRIEKRDSELDEHERALTAREDSLRQSLAKLDARDKGIQSRQLELERAQTASVDRDARSWKELARFFQDGEAGDIAKRLATFEPKDAARILRELDDERAVAILNALSTEKYRAFLEAYRKQVQ